MTWPPTLRRRSRREWLSLGVVGLGLVGFVGLVYVVVVVGGGLLLGETSAPGVGLSVLATAIVALGFDGVLTRLEAFATRVVQRGRPAPYDALRRFTSSVADRGPDGDLPSHMARLLAEGTGAAWAQVWVAGAETPLRIATWPPEAEERLTTSPEWDSGTRRLMVRHGGEDLGMLVLRERPGAELTPVEERLFTSLASQAGLVLRGAQLRASLERRLTELSAREAELRVSRERLVDAQDAARRRLERDIHDGAQQHLVALAVNLRLAATLSAGSPERAGALLDAQEEAAADAMAALVHLSRGIYPPLLAAQGVAAALRAVAGDDLVIESLGVRRHAPAVEAAAYFCCLEALQNAAKHAGATRVRVELDSTEETLTATVTDDGVGFDPSSVTAGTGLANLRDRVDAVGGTWALESRPGAGTRVRVELPARAPATSGWGD
ncbi:MAG: histidine kinase [Nocardioidaceae bacterium]